MKDEKLKEGRKPQLSMLCLPHALSTLTLLLMKTDIFFSQWRSLRFCSDLCCLWSGWKFHFAFCCNSAHTLGHISELIEVVFREIPSFFWNWKFLLVFNKEIGSGVCESACLQSTTVSIDLDIMGWTVHCPPKLRTTWNILNLCLLWKDILVIWTGVFFASWIVTVIVEFLKVSEYGFLLFCHFTPTSIFLAACSEMQDRRRQMKSLEVKFQIDKISDGDSPLHLM